MTYTKESKQSYESQDPENNVTTPNKEKNPKSKRGLFMALGGGALTTTLLVVGLAVLPKGERGGGTTDAPSATEGTSQTSEPSPSPTTATETQPGSFEFKAPVLEQTHTIAEMEAMTDLKTFSELPYADRLAYALAKNPHIELGTPNDDTGFQNPNAIPGYYWYGVDGQAMGDANTLDGAKVISANEYYTTNAATGELSDSYKAASDSVLQNGGEGVAIGTTEVFVASGAWQSGADRTGNPIDFIDITVYNSDAHTGERKGPDTTYQTLRQEVKLLDGTIVIAYPRAYGIEGKQSPIEGGVY